VGVVWLLDDRRERPVHVEQNGGALGVGPEGLEQLVERGGGLRHVT
jgi:hypothetical protein